MEKVYLAIVVILFLLAISDLIVGVSNDAVNFLNSAIGSKAAPFKIIMILAALGILAGTTFSSGMMEVARKGIFHPDKFVFYEIMIIFLAVMITDVILLDLYNTFGLPTSTTVSIVFELLGAAVGVATIKVIGANGEAGKVSEFINSEKALVIISGILLSVIVAFTVGMIVQFIARTIFSFNYLRSIKYFGAVWGGIAVTVIVYFILIKGLKGSSFADRYVDSIPIAQWSNYAGKQDYKDFASMVKSLDKSTSNEAKDWKNKLDTYNKNNYKEGIQELNIWISANDTKSILIPVKLKYWVLIYTLKIMFIGFIFWTFLFLVLQYVFKTNIFRVIVMVGTFALAMAFAGNDLVNFIGVPLAGYESYNQFMADPGAVDSDFGMGGLADKVQTPTLYLLIAGLIMVITLWLSRKARNVVKTELNLSNQDEVQERFGTSMFSRTIVRNFLRLTKAIKKFTPKPLSKWFDKRFDPRYFKRQAKKDKKISFDLIRASVNLFVASILIALATSYKLPLSTTYVTFMVAMGTSLADGAWDRESAVYRINGVLTVIGGWFFTALSAFTVSFLVAILMIKTFPYAIIPVILVAAFIIYRTHILHKRRSAEEKLDEEKLSLVLELDSESIYESCSNNVVSILVASDVTLVSTVNALIAEKRKKLNKSFKSSKKISNHAKKLKKNIPGTIKKLSEESFESGHYYVEVIDYLREAMSSLYNISSPAFSHVDNNHKPLNAFQSGSLKDLSKKMSDYIHDITKDIGSSTFVQLEKRMETSDKLIAEINDIRKKQIKLIKKESGSTRTTLLYLDIINEIKNFILFLSNVYKSFEGFAVQNNTYKSNKDYSKK